MISIHQRGRLGNNLIQLMAGAVLAEKVNINPTAIEISRGGMAYLGYKKVDDFELDYIRCQRSSLANFGFKFYKGNQFVFSETPLLINEKNYFDIIESNPDPEAHYSLSGYFQKPMLLVDYRDIILRLINTNSMEFKIKPKENDAFVACRLGDTVGTRNYFRPSYLESHLKKNRENYDSVYITSDSIDLPELQELIKKFDLKLCDNEITQPYQFLGFGSKFNNLILSAGSFNYLIGYFSKAKNITVCKSNGDPLQRNKAWSFHEGVVFEQ